MLANNDIDKLTQKQAEAYIIGLLVNNLKKKGRNMLEAVEQAKKILNRTRGN